MIQIYMDRFFLDFISLAKNNKTRTNIFMTSEVPQPIIIGRIPLETKAEATSNIKGVAMSPFVSICYNHYKLKYF